jgi:large subunit ribosomal protein L9
MKVILNHDVPGLGELGDVKDVAAGYARNYLLPRGLVLAYSGSTIALFEKRRAEIEARKAEKRQASSDIKTRLEAEEIVLDMPAGHNGKLYGAVTNASIADELHKKGYDIDRKKIEVPGRVLKSVGNYKIQIRLYEKDEAVLRVVVKGHEEKPKDVPGSHPVQRKRRDYREEAQSEAAAVTETTAEAAAVDQETGTTEE